ncbi:lymphocyte antigen 75-like [Clarias gariepinus]|uniref:lymphocyte antigen 75-like n=1 Tax=Clarias gariepinus TaxID=13013 RepID=UPI00234DD833|nr:lymphocyte antigen 75-like [Clarias gariepinus]
MKAYLFLLSFIGVVPIPSLLQSVGHNYSLIMTKVTWPVAQSYCRETYEDLATVESDRDWLIINAKVSRESLTDVAWVGLYYIYSNPTSLSGFHWAYENISVENSYQRWSTAGQPNFGNGLNSCGYTGPMGYWWLTTCTSLFPFICFNAGNDYADKYVGVTTKKTWKKALSYCRKFHTDLAFMGNLTDNDAMQKIAYVQGSSWIGMYRNTWNWSDKTQTSDLLWLPGQPTNAYPTDYCAVLDNRMFSETKCDELHYFFCQSTFPVQTLQILKLQVMSDMRIFDSNVQSAILELVKKKMDESSMLGNTTLTWRVQSDGQIFKKGKNNF